MSQTTTAALAFQDVGPQFLPADGYTIQPGIAGYTAFFDRVWNRSAKAMLQNVALSGNVGRFHDPSGNMAQTDAGAQVSFNGPSGFRVG